MALLTSNAHKFQLPDRITTLYSQVWWAPLAPVSFPPHIIKKYAGKAVAFVGWEIDQVTHGTVCLNPIYFVQGSFRFSSIDQARPRVVVLLLSLLLINPLFFVCVVSTRVYVYA